MIGESRLCLTLSDSVGQRASTCPCHVIMMRGKSTSPALCSVGAIGRDCGRVSARAARGGRYLNRTAAASRLALRLSV